MAYQSPQKLPPIYNNEKLVVYGLIKHLKDTRGLIQGNVVLRGEILGDSFQHTVPIGSTPNSSGIYPVHRLAAKGLITDWQDAGKSKDSIVTLSVESSVVSKHTAFIAVDDKSSVPIEGAMKSWDIMCIQNESQRFGGVRGRGGGGGGPKFKKMAKGGAAPSPRSHGHHPPNVKCSPRSAPPMRLAYASYAAPLPPPGAGSCFKPPIQAPTLFEGTSHALTKEMELDALAPLALSSGYDAPTVSSMKTAEFPTSLGSTDILTSVIASQQANGSWKLDSSIAKIFTMSVKEVEDTCPQVLKENQMVVIWVTVLVLTVLEKKCSNHKDEWELLDLKARSWLKKQSLPSGMKVDEVFTAAESCIKQ